LDNRYSRQTLFRPIGDEGQRRLEQAVVSIIGCGALGSAAAETLVRAGVGTLQLIDRDVVELSNLQRQNLFTESHAFEQIPKVVAAEQRLRDIRSDVLLSTTIDHADGKLIEQLVRTSDLVIDATDNFETRLMINDAAHKYNRPWIYGACVGSGGVVFPFIPGVTACFRCLLPVLPALNETCDSTGIISPAVQVTAALQCAEALKWLTGNKDRMMSKVHHFDLWSDERMNVGVSKIKLEDCPTCGLAPTYPSLATSDQAKFVVLCGRETVQIIPDRQRTITLDDVERVGERSAKLVRRTPYFVEIALEPYRLIAFNNGRILIHGLRDKHEARKLYHKLFG